MDKNKLKYLWTVLVISSLLLTECQSEEQDGIDSKDSGEEDEEHFETHLWSRLSKDHSSREKRDAGEQDQEKGSKWTNESVLKRRSLLSTQNEEPSPRAPPSFEKDFDASIRVVNLHTMESYLVLERVIRDTVTLKMFRYDGDDKEQICTYSKASGFGHTIYGLECLPAVNLPAGCFCTSGLTPTPYLPLTDLLDALETKGEDPVPTNVTYRHFVTWTVRENNLDMTATFLERSASVVEGDLAVAAFNESLKSGGAQQLVPFSLRVAHNASNPQNYFTKRDRLCGEIFLEYTIQRFDFVKKNKALNPEQEDTDHHQDHSKNKKEEKTTSAVGGPGPMGGEVIQGTSSVAPEGIFCQRPDIYRRRLPDMPDQFSVKIETVDESQNSVTYSEQHYDVSHKLVSFKFAPRSHSPPAVFFARFILSSAFPNEVFYIIHDFQTQLQYTINERTGNCSIQRIPLTASDSEMQESSHSLRIKHAKELLEVDPKKFVYAGERHVRGIPVDVWVAEKPVAVGYQTTEIYFSRHDWNILVEEVNAHQEIPLGMAIFRADFKNSSRFSSKVESHYIEFNPSQPAWKFFDVSSCMRDMEKLYLKLTLDVSYSQLVQFSLQRAHDSIRKAISGISKVSPLRISDLHLSTTPGDKEGIDVWFVMLESPKLSEEQISGLRVGSGLSLGSNGGPRQKELSVREAYRHLGTVTSQTDVTLRLQVSKDREMIAQVRRHSLQMAPESTHPSSHGRAGSYRFLRATYTAGSMAGLGFSMAILGVCIGLFLGFLLWKRRLGVPYQLSP